MDYYLEEINGLLFRGNKAMIWRRRKHFKGQFGIVVLLLLLMKGEVEAKNKNYKLQFLQLTIKMN